MLLGVSVCENSVEGGEGAGLPAESGTARLCPNPQGGSGRRCCRSGRQERGGALRGGRGGRREGKEREEGGEERGEPWEKGGERGSRRAGMGPR